MKRNVDVVACHGGFAHWAFFIDEKARAISNAQKHGIRIIRELFELWDDVFVPTSIEYTLIGFESDLTPSALFASEPSDRYSQSIESNNRLVLSDVLDQVENVPVSSNHLIWILTRLSVEEGKTRIYLENSDDHINSESDSYVVWPKYSGNPGGRPSIDPLTVQLHFERPLEDKYPKWKITVRANTDIWFEKTRVGEVNRQRLGNFIGNLETQFQPSKAWFDSDRIGESTLRDQGWTQLLVGE